MSKSSPNTELARKLGMTKDELYFVHFNALESNDDKTLKKLKELGFDDEVFYDEDELEIKKEDDISYLDALTEKVYNPKKNIDLLHPFFYCLLIFQLSSTVSYLFCLICLVN